MTCGPDSPNGMPHRQTPSAATLLADGAPLRVWSLIVTIFGDHVTHRGQLADQAASGQDLVALLARMGVEAGIARTNIARLVQNGVLTRQRAGRNAFYTLSNAQHAAFRNAATQIYAQAPPPPAALLGLALLDAAPDRKAARVALEAQGFRFSSPFTGLCLHAPAAPPPLWPQGVVALRVPPTADWAPLVQDLWGIARLDTHYTQFCRDFETLHTAAPGTDPLALRLVLVHRFRRMVLRDPNLPAALLPPDWHGQKARALFTQNLAQLSR